MITLDARARKTLRKMNGYDWTLTRSFKPRRCRMSGAKIRIFSKAYKGIYTVSVPGIDVILTRWITPEVFMFEILKGTL